MRLTFATYNIHKGVGVDRRRDPMRIISVLREIDAWGRRPATPRAGADPAT